MAESPLADLLRQLCSRDSSAAWAAFLDEYAPLVLQVVRHFESDIDDASDCFQFVCEQLCDHRFRRLRRFDPQGPAKFSTWLRAVVRNLSLDWRRKKFGRPRVFRSIARLSQLEQEIFHIVIERGGSEQEALVALSARFPDLTPTRISEAIERINQNLTTNQSWLLQARSATTMRSTQAAGSETEPTQMADSRSDPEARAILRESRKIVMRAVSRLTTKEKLIIRLRFEEELTLEQIATLLDLGNAQRADRQIKQVLSTLRASLGDVKTSGGKNSRASVKLDQRET